MASPAYLAREGIPATPHELAAHTLIGSSAGNFASGWRFRFPNGEQTLRVRPRLVVSTNDAAIEAASAGFGITSVLSYQPAEAVAAGRLQILLEDFELPVRPIHIIHREGPQSATKVRAFIDLLKDRLRGEPALAGG